MKKINFITLLAALVMGLTATAQKKWTLQECVEHALKNNISIKQTALDTEVAKIDKSDAVGNFLPTINANAMHSWNIGLNQNITTGLLENQTTQFTSAGLNIGVNIFSGLQAQNRLRRANLAIVAAQYSLTKMRDDVSLNVANAFLQILFNKENLKVQRAQLATNEQQLTRTQGLVDAGSVPRGDLMDMRATVATSNTAVINAENALLISRLALAQLLQIEDFENFDIVDQDYAAPDSPTLNESPDAIFQKAKEIRTEIKLAQANLDVAERDVRIAKGNFYPNLQGFYSFSTRAAYADQIVGIVPAGTTVIGTVEGTNQNVIQQNFAPVIGSADPVFEQFSDNKGHSFGLQLNIPILNGFAARNSVARAKVGLERFKIAKSQAELDLERNVYQAFTDAKGALKAYESAAIALEARQQAFDYAKEKYEVGMMNAFDYNQAQLLYSNAQSELLRTKYDYIFKVKLLEFYFGIPITLN
jgi:outer membrane protein